MCEYYFNDTICVCKKDNKNEEKEELDNDQDD